MQEFRTLIANNRTEFLVYMMQNEILLQYLSRCKMEQHILIGLQKSEQNYFLQCRVIIPTPAWQADIFQTFL